jgi:hypothetical protein
MSAWMTGSPGSSPWDQLSDDALRSDDGLKQAARAICGDGWFEEPNARLDWETPAQAVAEGRRDEVKDILRGIAAGGMT